MDLNFKVTKMKQNILYLFLLFAAISCGENGGVAPAAGDSGCTNCRIFVSAATSNGGIGLQGFDDLCNADGNKPTDGSTYKALLSSGTRNKDTADWPLRALTSYYRLSGEKITSTDATGVFIFNLSNSIATFNTDCWTGLNVNMSTSTGYTCSEWSSTTGFFGNMGISDSTDTYAIGGRDTGCSNARSVYCVEQ